MIGASTKSLVAELDHELRRILSEDSEANKIRRAKRREKWARDVAEHRERWKAECQAATVVDPETVRAEVQKMFASTRRAYYSTLTAPLFAITESIDRSVHIISIFASPSGAGPERYAPKADAIASA